MKIKRTQVQYKTHDWSDTSFDWEQLENAINFITDRLYSRGHFWVSSKEKWGQARVSVYFWDGNLLSFLPYNQREVIPYWLKHFFAWHLSKVICFFKLDKLFHIWQRYIFRQTYTEACELYPDLIGEILGGCGHEWLLEDLFLELDLETPCKSLECWDGKHKYNTKNYCSECFHKKGSPDEIIE